MNQVPTVQAHTDALAGARHFHPLRAEYIFGLSGGCPGHVGSRCTLGLRLAGGTRTVGTTAHNCASGHGVR